MKCVSLILLFFVYMRSGAENAHDAIMRANEEAREEALLFGDAVEQPKLFEGDIVESPDSNFYDTGGNKWEGGVVPYVFGNLGSKGRNAVAQAIADYNRHTCIKIVPRSNQRNYISFEAKGGCFSMIGCTRRGKQTISLGRGCEYKGTAIHEIMHALGFYHEQSRNDRDGYITIHWNNIQSGMDSQFKKYRSNTYGFGYDKQSVMHYSRYAFSRNRQPTISSKTNQNEKLGNDNGFSQIDIAQINKHYGCSGGGGGGGPNPPPTDCKDIHSRGTEFCQRYANKYCQRSTKFQHYCKKTCNKC